MVAAEEDIEAARSAEEEATHADLAAALTAGLKKGDPCPVCGVPLSSAPRRPAAAQLARAKKRAADAERARDEAREATRRAETARREAERDLERAAKDLEQLERELSEHAARIEAAERELVGSLRSKKGEELLGVVEARLAGLEELSGVEDQAERAAQEARDLRSAAERGLDGLRTRIAEQRVRLELPVPALLRRAATLTGTAVPAHERAAQPPPSDELDALRAFAEALSKGLGSLVSDLESVAERRMASEPELLEEAVEAVGGLVEEARSLGELLSSVTAARKLAGETAATTEQRAVDLAERLARRADLERDVGELEVRARRFRALALELRADRLIAFLQGEALQLLAAAGSERLSTLSDGRYRLACRDDEFFAVDTWNGDEERSVRTLSGGETFLASLALALALSEQVRSLSVTERARLDSLFLDEGFGTLDAETLRVVVETIEQLGGDGRLVGVITHVNELAEHFPRLEVRKSQRGSRVEFVP